MRSLIVTLFLALFALSAPLEAQACACGCGVFAVGTSSLLPEGPGGTAFLEYDYMNQTQNWSGSSSAPAANNDDKNIRSDFYVAGLQYMFNRDWGVSLEVPYTERLFITEDGGQLGSFDHSAFGDVRLMGMYTGFSDDMSTGLSFGLKFANGDYTYQGFDRDTSIGTGTTNLLLGIYHQMNLKDGTGAIDFELCDRLLPRSGPAKDVLAAASGMPEDFVSLCLFGRIELADGERRVRARGQAPVRFDGRLACFASGQLVP